MSKSGKITIALDELSIKNKSALKNLRFIRFSSSLVPHGDQLYFALSGHPYLYKFNPKQLAISERITLGYYGDLSFEVVQHSAYGYGLRTPPINNSIFSYNGAIYTSHGNRALNVKPALVIFDPVLGARSHVINIETMVDMPVIKILDGKMVIHEFLLQASNYVEIW